MFIVYCPLRVNYKRISDYEIAMREQYLFYYIYRDKIKNGKGAEI